MDRNDSTTEEEATSSSSNALNIIESDEQDRNAEAFADMTTSSMEMNLELPIRSFLTRNDVEEQEKSKLSAYEVLRNGAVHYSRREDKMRALQKHPVVVFVAADGRTVGCKCGRNVRLNPPWYILKFEQHVASRNCTFLRQNNKKRKKTETREAGGSLEEHEEREKAMHIDSGQEQVAEGGDQDDGEEVNDYSLQSVDVILQREFGLVANGQQTIVPPSDTLSDARLRMLKGAVVLRDNPQFKRITPDGRFAECKCLRIVLLSAPWQPGQFLMHVADKQKPKELAKTASAAVKSVERKQKKRVCASGLSSSTAGRSVISLGLPMRPTIANAFVQAHKTKKSFPREVRWDIAQARGLLPCPGLRDERMKMFVTSSIQLTGGARYRHKIARELFPHLFSDSSEYDPTDEADHEVELDHLNSQSSSKKRQPKLQQQLLEAEKLLLHDVIEGEALWFVDKDGNSVRSLDCLGIVDSSKGDTRCASCTVLRSNAALKAAAAAKYKMAMLSEPPRNPINRKFCSGCVCSLLEAEFDMREPFARVLRDLALADIPSALNTWMEMATMGLSGVFDTHPALLGLTEAMVRLKDKEQRGVGLQNMTYSNLLDTFMRSLADLSPDACELFQKHLGGRKQRQLQAVKSVVPSGRRLQLQTSSDGSRTGQDQQTGESLYDGVGNSATVVRVTSDEGFVHLLDPCVVGLEMPPLSIGDIQDIDLSTFPAPSAMQLHGNQSNSLVRGDEVILTVSPVVAESALTSESDPADKQARKESECQGDICMSSTTETTSVEVVTSVARTNHDDVTDEPKETVIEGQTESDPDSVAFLTELSSPKDNSKTNGALMPSDHVPCTGLRDENVQAYVANAVQIVGGSRPRYVIARELFPQVFANDKKVRIVDKLSNEQRLVLQDAVFSECLWRVDKEGRCVRSLRCKRFVPAPRNHARGSSQNQGVCRACRDLRTVPNFRSVLSRSKMPKKLENIKYVPSVYTKSDPFLRKLSKNSAFRGLYQCVKGMAAQGPERSSEAGTERLKRVHFWLRFARMGVFGHFKSHPVFEGLMKSMVEVKDKERRGVGKQNMQYSAALDKFMQNMAQISIEAFELFAAKFCGRTLRSQKVKRRSTSTAPSVFTTPAKTAELTSLEGNSGGVVFTAHSPIAQSQPPQHQHYLMAPDDLLSGRSLSSEESQRFMDCMLDEVRLSVSREMQLVAEEERRGIEKAGDIPTSSAEHEQQTDEGDDNHLNPETYLNDEGVLITEI
ncbi:unnamed protein product [Peronospora destructor]|uniref:Uncharacterized protein n=1 Tax=Peronospora destructor TaxID=86335 RepID=A0AAV0UI62_9STRA|nr:unnamed protein product [Peronospora destructor]